MLDNTEGVLTQKENKLDSTLCRKFLNYELPITTTEVSDTEIEDIFIRINSSGRKLSSQDLRQAGAVGPFSDLVRKTACYIRGDIAEGDIVPLAEMPALSLSNRKLNYEVRVSDTFWIQNGIITEKNIRLSRDEEIIARIYSYMILGESVSPSSNALTNMYDMKSAQNHKLNSYVEQHGIPDIMDPFSKIYADFHKLFASVDSDFSSWIFKNYNAKGKAKVFQAIFLALYELRKDMYVIQDYEEVATALRHVGDKEFREITDDREWNVKIRNDTIRRVKGILQPLMIKNVSIGEDDTWKSKLESLLLSASGMESQMFDFKLGLTTLDTGQRNDKCIPKIVKTLIAMGNTFPDKEAMILIGIANDAEDAQQFKEHYRANWVEAENCYVTGVDEEIKRYWRSKEEYCDYIKSMIEREKVLPEVSGQILRNFKSIVYEGKTLINLTYKNPGQPIAYDSVFFERHGSHNKLIKVNTPEFYDLIGRTSKKDID